MDILTKFLIACAGTLCFEVAEWLGKVRRIRAFRQRCNITPEEWAEFAKDLDF